MGLEVSTRSYKKYSLHYLSYFLHYEYRLTYNRNVYFIVNLIPYIMLFTMPIHKLPFRHWILRERENKGLLILAIGVIVVQFIVFKILYPFPNLIDESYLAIEAAHKNWAVGYLSVGYPMFLRLVSSFTSNDTVLIFLQYILLQAAILYFLYSIKYLLLTGKWLSRILIFICILNPVPLYVSNLVTNDSLLATLMLGWFTHLLWILFQPRLASLLWHSSLLLLLFMVKYDVWYCAIISVFIFFFLRLHWRVIAIGIGTIVILFGVFIGGTQSEFKRRSGEIQFAARLGWQKAANALYAYAHADTLDRKKVQWDFYELHGVVNEHMASLKMIPKYIRPDRRPNEYYFDQENTPLKIYMQKKWEKNDSASAFKKWAALGPLYAQYGNFLVSQYPGLFWGHYILPNLRNYYLPETEAISSYNKNKDTVSRQAVAWFHWESNKVRTVFEDKTQWLSYYAVVPMAVINFLFTFSFLALLLIGGFSPVGPYAKQILWLLLFTWLLNLFFSVWASPIVLQQQVFTVQLTLTFSIIFVWMLIQMALSDKTQKDWLSLTRLRTNQL